MNKTYIFIVVVFLGFTFNSCDEETTVVPKTLEQFKSETTIYINNEIAKVNACVIGYDKGNFKATSSVAPNYNTYKNNYLNALNAAMVTINKADVTIARVIAAQGTLTPSGKLFNDALWISDRRALNDLVVSTTALNSATLVGTAVGNVSQAAKDAFATAISTAKSARDSGLTTQRMVDEAVTNLEAAKQTFLSAIVK